VFAQRISPQSVGVYTALPPTLLSSARQSA